jgi:DNA-binding transcriptional regulator YhcF (GntR family)
MSVVKISQKKNKPKYKQIIESIEQAISNGKLKTGDQLPSLNEIKNENGISRDTVLYAFNELKNRGIIDSTVGKGYYVTSENIKVQTKVFLLFDELNAFKEELFNSLLKHFGENVLIDVYFHHFNKKFFEDIIKRNLDSYTYYIIMPANLVGVEPIINLIEKEKVFILDQMRPELYDYSAVFQDFEKDVYNGLTELQIEIKKYKNFKLIFSPKNQPLGILKGFKSFCESQQIRHQVLPEFNETLLSKGDLFFLLNDKHLILIIKKMKEKGFEIAKDYGIISYNETMLKEVIEGGITTISTDFKLMGKQISEMILQNRKGQIANINRVKTRKSL